MKRLLMSAFIVPFIVAGCATVVSDCPETPRDSEKYESKSVTTADYKNRSYVLLTRGEGEIACVTLGAGNGIKKGAVIEFYRLDTGKSGRYEVPFASGTVIQVSKDTCWVEVDNPESAGVKVNHFARLALEQPKGPIETVKGWFKKSK